jgi:hypothetical protein
MIYDIDNDSPLIQNEKVQGSAIKIQTTRYLELTHLAASLTQLPSRQAILLHYHGRRRRKGTSYRFRLSPTAEHGHHEKQQPIILRRSPH